MMFVIFHDWCMDESPKRGVTMDSQPHDWVEDDLMTVPVVAQ